MLKNLKNIVVVSLSTVGSRVLGLVRDILIFAALGASAWNDAFILAFTLPNLFRRLLGEGALTSAMVPIFSDVLQRAGRSAAFAFFNQVLLRLLLILSALVVSGMLVFGTLAKSGMLSDRWSLGAELAVVLLPYMIFICLAAIISAGLNILGRFAVAASTPMLLNLAMIGALVAGMWLNDDQARIVYWLCGGVLVGGLFQLMLPAWDLARQGWRPRLQKRRASAEMSELWRLFLPGLMGAAILQVNILVSRLLAYSLDESAVSVLYLASRLMELPLGIFTVAVATVFFPLLARAVSDKDDQGFASALTQGMRLVVGISLPAGVGLFVLGQPILELLFRWGAFSTQNVAQTIPLIAIYGLGLPFYSAATFATRGLHACKDMKTPVRVAGLCLVVNLISGLVLMQFFGACGLAAGNVLAAIVQSACLWRALSKHRSEVGFSHLRGAFAKILCAGVAMGLFCFIGHGLVLSFELADKLNAAVIVGVFVPGGAALYFGVLYMLKFEELDLLAGMVRRVLPKRR
ncbi:MULTISPECIES: murein biosynthesis integral membrane protein MurJ [unclassified Lentimonas]|uniref:murein biosynthesis integral membrane protein MurJ n=1 Tax=unclassified Lentimonas TaxID=2630993 RepID=UPI001321A5BC|nr:MULTISPECIES: murein biosynthesis integral membrane protein MurJ [unclassified Lentimonas]CAA6678918.1 Proposed peptidoglycan lipid II flippase MurJ [Lentimonas sp. CC4]CAA6684524.1 Proposed peptidoglycan lipid II flippase MurJ [Lentimonas sp. CC6]CAA7077398.1 Proposed peptidoglycan lipid II flippase MurJ [Lentimonas sp. CC4]CAA7171234.1 Proposed peptidoglycan lipid II flippase MurJ [Lentimonas sp. CC21]CAA7183263.1 Proposed peptidoglycan lipid II flippase MurJ [Lentimonas sp. CC8]